MKKLKNGKNIFPLDAFFSCFTKSWEIFDACLKSLSFDDGSDVKEEPLEMEILKNKCVFLENENKKLEKEISRLLKALGKDDATNVALNETVNTSYAPADLSAEEMRKLDVYEEEEDVSNRDKKNRDLVIDILQKKRMEMDETIHRLLVHKEISGFVNSNLDIKNIIDFICNKIEKLFQIEAIIFELYDSDSKKGSIVKVSQKKSIDGILKNIDLTLFEGESFDVKSDLTNLKLAGSLLKDHCMLYQSSKLKEAFGFECIVFNIISQKELLGRFLIKPYGSLEVFKSKRHDMLSDIFSLITPAVKTSLVLSRMAYVNNKLASKEKLIFNDLEVAKRLVESLLATDYSHFKELDFFLYYKPLYEIGGDFIDISRLENGCIRIFVADAVGHGIQAALITMLIKSLYDKLKNKSDDPSEILSELNSSFCNLNSQMLIYFTGIIADINVGDGKVSFVSAGHPPQFILKQDKIVRLKASGHLVGYLDDGVFSKTEEKISKGDKIILFTDGLYEEFSKDQEELGYERFLSYVGKAGSLSVEELGRGIVENVEGWIKGAEPFDDMSLIVCMIK